MSGFVLGENEGLNINFHGTKMIIKVSEKDSEGRYSLIVMVNQANSGPAPLVSSKLTRGILCS